MCQYMVLPLKGEPTLIYPHYGCHIEAARKMVSVRDVRSGQHGKYGKAVAERLIELKLQKGRIGITAANRTGPEYMGVQAYLDLQKLLPQASFVFCPTLFHELTYRKSAEELRAMAKAGQLAIKALEAVKATAKPGVREYQLAGAVANAVLSGGGRYHLLMIGSTSMRDPKLIFPNPNPSARVLKEGDIVLSELAMSYMGYSAKIGHPVSIGRPTERYQAFFKDVVVGGFKEIRALLKPGTTLEDVRKVGSQAFRKRGAQSRPTIMHGLDLITSVPFIRADRVRTEPYDMTMQPGMTYNIEITPVDSEGVFGIFYSRSFAITEPAPMTTLQFCRRFSSPADLSNECGGFMQIWKASSFCLLPVAFSLGVAGDCAAISFRVRSTIMPNARPGRYHGPHRGALPGDAPASRSSWTTARARAGSSGWRSARTRTPTATRSLSPRWER
jgi:Xaa-Pro aminopeptidase